MNLMQLLNSGASLRFRPPYKFYAVLNGNLHPVKQSEVTTAAERGAIRANGRDPHGVYLFALNKK